MSELLGFTTAALRGEVGRRARAIRLGLCDACGERYDDLTCQNLRHGDAAALWFRSWTLATEGDAVEEAFEQREHGARVKTLRFRRRWIVELWAYQDAGATFRSCAASVGPQDMPSSLRARLEWAIEWAELEHPDRRPTVGEAGR